MIIRLCAAPKKIFRYMPVYRLIDMLSTNHLGMLNTTMWKDPFEGFLFDQYIEKHPRSPHCGLKKSLYCVCFSVDTETDQFWRSYTPANNGVRIRVPVDKLKSALDDRFVLASIEYKSRRKMKKVLKKHLKDDNHTAEELRDLFLYKLLGFHTDQEIRLVTIDDRNQETIKNVEIDIFGLIDDIMWDPRMPDTLCSIYREHIEKTYTLRGQKSPRIHKSTLYDPRKHLRL